MDVNILLHFPLLAWLLVPNSQTCLCRLGFGLLFPCFSASP